MLCHHNLEEYLTAYLGGAGLRGDPNGPVYRTIGRGTGQLTRTVGSPAETAGDALGDVDAFIEQYEEETRKVPKIAAEIARRLLSTGRAREAWQTIEATEHRRGNGSWDWPDFESEDPRIDVLDALDAPKMLKPHVEDALSIRCRPPTSGRI